MRLLALPLAALVVAPVLVGTADAAAPAFTVKALTITTTVASEDVLGAPATCVVDADLYTPAGVDKAHPAPAILTTNGFGGSKADQAGLGAAYAKKGYVVLSYSGLGFGADPQTGRRGSDCKITLDDRQHDGTAASQLVDVLGGLKVADDGTKVDYVVKDAKGSDGKAHAGDPRVGMVGGSYGGEIQFAAAGVDPRIDTIVPLITWNDLAYSLSPNNTSLPADSVSYTSPGTEKIDWTTLFFSLGFADGVQGAVTATDPTRLGPCPNFADEACRSKVSMDALGYADDTTVAFARNASVTTYLDKINVPVLLGQGQADTLFTLHEAATTYTALKKRGVPVKMVWQQWGHSHGPVAGEFDLATPDTNYEGRMITAWFDHYLKGTVKAPALDFTYYQPWLDKGDANTAFTSLPSYPVKGTTTLFGSAGTSLVRTRTAITAGSSSIAVPAGGAPLSYTETSALDQSQPVTDLPGGTTGLSFGPLAQDVDVVGVPTATLQLSSPTAAVSQASGPAGSLVAFVKLYDVAPDGTITLPNRLIAPIRVADITKPVTVSLPGIVHRFPKGHTLKLVVSLSDAAYKGNNLAQALTLSSSAAAPTTLTLPGTLFGQAAAAPRPVGTAPQPTAATGSTGSLPTTGLGTVLPVAALVLLAGAAAVRRRTA